MSHLLPGVGGAVIFAGGGEIGNFFGDVLGGENKKPLGHGGRGSYSLSGFFFWGGGADVFHWFLLLLKD